MTMRPPFIRAICFSMLFCGLIGDPRMALAEISASSTDPRIRLEIYSATSTLFYGDVSVAPCAQSASSSLSSSAYCAIQQSGLESSWTSYGESRFLDGIRDVVSDSGQGWYWNWFSDLNYGQTSLDQHQVADGEGLMLLIGRMPLRIMVSTTTPMIGSTTTVSVYEFGFDDSWNGVWLPSASSSLFINDMEASSEADGVYELSVSTSTRLSVVARRVNFLDSRVVEIAPVSLVFAAEVGPVVVEAESGSSGGSSAGGTQGMCSFDLEKAFVFLESQQNADGSFGSSLYGDWSAIALSAGARGLSLDKVRSSVIGDSSGLSTATDYERRAMALMSLGVNPGTGTSVDYIQAIVSHFDGTQIGDPHLVNDDIFAILPLIRSGYSSGDTVIASIVAFIVSRQSDDGSWGQSVDLTAAAIQSLSLVPDVDGARGAINRARSYLVSRQRDDGGFGSSFSTSWSLQAIGAMGENGSAWIKPGGTPASSLCVLQANDGGIGPVTDDAKSRLWATAYAIPAVMGKTWQALMGSFSVKVIPPVSMEAVSPVIEPRVEGHAEPVATSSIATESSVLVPAPSLNVVAPRLYRVEQVASTVPVALPVVENVPVAAVAASGVAVSPWLIATAGIITSLAVVYVVRLFVR